MSVTNFHHHGSTAFTTSSKSHQSHRPSSSSTKNNQQQQTQINSSQPNAIYLSRCACDLAICCIPSLEENRTREAIFHFICNDIVNPRNAEFRSKNTSSSSMMKARSAGLRTVGGAVAAVAGGATLPSPPPLFLFRTFGSWHTGLSIASSDVDLCLFAEPDAWMQHMTNVVIAEHSSNNSNSSATAHAQQPSSSSCGGETAPQRQHNHQHQHQHLQRSNDIFMGEVAGLVQQLVSCTRTAHPAPAAAAVNHDPSPKASTIHANAAVDDDGDEGATTTKDDAAVTEHPVFSLVLDTPSPAAGRRHLRLLHNASGVQVDMLCSLQPPLAVAVSSAIKTKICQQHQSIALSQFIVVLKGLVREQNFGADVISSHVLQLCAIAVYEEELRKQRGSASSSSSANTTSADAQQQQNEEQEGLDAAALPSHKQHHDQPDRPSRYPLGVFELLWRFINVFKTGGEFDAATSSVVFQLECSDVRRAVMSVPSAPVDSSAFFTDKEHALNILEAASNNTSSSGGAAAAHDMTSPSASKSTSSSPSSFTSPARSYSSSCSTHACSSSPARCLGGANSFVVLEHPIITDPAFSPPLSSSSAQHPPCFTSTPPPPPPPQQQHMMTMMLHRDWKPSNVAARCFQMHRFRDYLAELHRRLLAVYPCLHTTAACPQHHHRQYMRRACDPSLGQILAPEFCASLIQKHKLIRPLLSTSCSAVERKDPSPPVVVASVTPPTPLQLQHYETASSSTITYQKQAQQQRSLPHHSVATTTTTASPQLRHTSVSQGNGDNATVPAAARRRGRDGNDDSERQNEREAVSSSCGNSQQNNNIMVNYDRGSHHRALRPAALPQQQQQQQRRPPAAAGAPNCLVRTYFPPEVRGDPSVVILPGTEYLEDGYRFILEVVDDNDDDEEDTDDNTAVVIHRHGVEEEEGDDQLYQQLQQQQEYQVPHAPVTLSHHQSDQHHHLAADTFASSSSSTAAAAVQRRLSLDAPYYHHHHHHHNDGGGAHDDQENLHQGAATTTSTTTSIKNNLKAPAQHDDQNEQLIHKHTAAADATHHHSSTSTNQTPRHHAPSQPHPSFCSRLQLRMPCAWYQADQRRRQNMRHNAVTTTSVMPMADNEGSKMVSVSPTRFASSPKAPHRQRRSQEPHQHQEYYHDGAEFLTPRTATTAETEERSTTSAQPPVAQHQRRRLPLSVIPLNQLPRA